MSNFYVGFWLFLTFLNIVFFGISLEAGNNMMAIFNLSVALCCILSIVSKKMMKELDPHEELRKIRAKRNDSARVTIARKKKTKEDKEDKG